LVARDSYWPDGTFVHNQFRTHNDLLHEDDGAVGSRWQVALQLIVKVLEQVRLYSYKSQMREIVHLLDLKVALK